MEHTSIKRPPALFLQSAIVLVGIAVLAFLIVMPNFEGRNAHSTLFQVYFNDPFLAYVYVGSIPFFLALRHAFALLGSMRNAAGRLRTIRNCAVALALFIAGAEAYIVTAMRGTEDIAGGVAMGALAMLVAVVIGAAAAALERRVRTA